MANSSTVKKSESTSKKSAKKIFVLDTSVLLYDNNSILSFDEHDVAIPITVLEELDKFKVGNDTKNFEAREVIRFIDRLSGKGNLNNWVKLPGEEKGKFIVLLHQYQKDKRAEEIYGKGKNDHRILNAALGVQEENPNTKVVLVTKDINLRVKAKALNVYAEDYLTGKVKELKKIQSGLRTIEGVDSQVISDLFHKGTSTEIEALGEEKQVNGYFVLSDGNSSVLTFYNGTTNLLERVEKMTTMGIKPKNAEQAFATHAILNPNVKLVTLQGVAGTGKTLIALAGALEQKKDFTQIILARPIIPLSNRDIGFLPGDANDKISPYMEPLFDNLKFIKSQYKGTERKFKMIEDMQNDGTIIITPLAFIRGRSLSNIIFIVDEAQNLTPHEVKTIITRAGEGTKIIFTGDVKQIDTPYLDEASNGLTYLIDRLTGSSLFANVVLEKGERSELANLANELL